MSFGQTAKSYDHGLRRTVQTTTDCFFSQGIYLLDGPAAGVREWLAEYEKSTKSERETNSEYRFCNLTVGPRTAETGTSHWYLVPCPYCRRTSLETTVKSLRARSPKDSPSH